MGRKERNEGSTNHIQYIDILVEKNLSQNTKFKRLGDSMNLLLLQCMKNPLIKLKGKETTSLLKIGPIPSQRGQSSSDLGKQTAWDEKGRNKLAQMFVSFGNDYINSIAFQYIEDGKLVISPVFGSPNLDGPNFVALRFTEATNNEYITRLSGSHGTKNYSTGQGVTSLTIETNAAIYGPFGNAGSNDPKFNISFGPENQFAGFHGTSSPEILTSIGVYVKPIDDLAALSNKTELHVE